MTASFRPGQEGHLVFDGKVHVVRVVGYLPSGQYIIAVIEEEKK